MKRTVTTKDVIRADKEVTDWGDWATGPVPRAQFFLSKSNQIHYGASWRWRVIRFTALERDFRVLALYRTDKEAYYSFLGWPDGRDMRVLCSWEHHGTHDGWHTHMWCDELDQIPIGRAEWDKRLRMPKTQTHHRRIAYGVTATNALDQVVKAFRLPLPPSAELRSQGVLFGLFE